jgi:ribosomal RNA assembly protein
LIRTRRRPYDSSRIVVEMEYVKIPRSRVAVLIGKDGKVKEEIEERLKVKLTVDEEGTVAVENVGEDVLAEWKARDMVKAIGRGLNPRKALKLTSDEYVLDVIKLQDIVGRSKKALIRQKGRIIGQGGKTRRMIEECTGTDVSVSGKTVAIIGTPERVQAARRAVVMLAKGIPHGVVYKMLQRKARELKEKSLSLWKQ